MVVTKGERLSERRSPEDMTPLSGRSEVRRHGGEPRLLDAEMYNTSTESEFQLADALVARLELDPAFQGKWLAIQNGALVRSADSLSEIYSAAQKDEPYMEVRYVRKGGDDPHKG